MRIRLSLLLVFCSIEVNCIPVEEFFPFGSSVVLDLGDDDSSDPIPLSPPFPLLGEDRTSLTVNTNGVISLKGIIPENNPRAFPYASGKILICPFWADLDSSSNGGGIISQSSVLDDIKTTKITQLIQESFGYSFVPTGVFTATWDAVPYFISDITNTFQCVLTTNGQDTFVFFLYADGLITNPAYSLQIGIDGGDRVNYYTVPNSLTPDIVRIARTSNVNQPGLWVFKVDDYNIIGGAPDVSAADLMVTGVGETNATLEWTLNAPSDKPESFVVTCVPDEASPHTTTINVTGYLEENAYDTQWTRFTWQITGFQENTDYTCSLIARNIFGDGPPSDAINVMTDSAGEPEDVMTEEPRTVTTSFLTTTSAAPSGEPEDVMTRNSNSITTVTAYTSVTESSSDNSLVYAVAGGVGGTLAMVVVVIVITVLLVIVVRKTKSKPTQNMEEPKHVHNDHETEDHVYETNMDDYETNMETNMYMHKTDIDEYETMDMYETITDVGQEMEEQVDEYEEMQYKASDTPTAAKHEAEVRYVMTPSSVPYVYTDMFT